MEEGTAIEDHLKHMKTLTDKLAAIDAVVTEEDQIVTLLGSLPDSYTNLVTALESRVDDLSLEFVHQSLKNEEQKRQEKRTESVNQSNDTALFSNRHYNKPRKPIVCFNCQLPGHIQRYCPGKPVKKADLQQHTANRVTSSDNLSDECSRDYAFVVSNPLPHINASWIIDSGASRHMTAHRAYFTEYRLLEVPEKVSLGDGHTVDAIGIGTVGIMLTLGRKVSRAGTIHDVLHVPRLAENLFSVRSATEKGKIIQFGNNRCWLKDEQGKVRAMGTLRNKLYYLDCEPLTRTDRAKEVASVAVNI